MNTNSEIQLRRYSDNLRMAGMAYVFFGIWAIIKIIASLAYNRKFIDELAKSLEGVDMTDRGARIALGVVFAVMFLVILYVHLRIGIAAIRYSKGRKRKGFLFLAFIVFVITVLSVFSDIADKERGLVAGYDDDRLASLVVDVTVLFMYIDMFVSIHMIDKNSKEIEAGEADK